MSGTSVETSERPVTGKDDAAEATIPTPAYRRLRVFSFDPSLATQLETAIFASVTFNVRWERGLKPGPIGEYIEVVDYDPASRSYYLPVDLNRPSVLARDGLDPSEGNPQFHQQMVYAVAMTTVSNFERALGRSALWAPKKLTADELKLEAVERYRREYVQRLRIYPHALRQANAYYSPVKKALLFGYFPAPREAGGLVFTCLSHDIIAHETTHALLDGMHGRYMEPSHPDARAFHEAFADLVALFQRFSIPDVLRNQIAKTRGDIAGTANMLGALAQQFGQATGHYGALRDAIGQRNPVTGVWEPRVPDPTEYRTQTEEHGRGAILVAGVFDAFLAIYRLRVADLQRIATNGTGILPQGDLHPDLVNRFAKEAAKTAGQMLNMCVRALDYCPPVDITFGDYLRALITADQDLVPDDRLGYRVALIEAFRRRGILPDDVKVISEESLRWDTGSTILRLDLRKSSTNSLKEGLGAVSGFLRQRVGSLREEAGREAQYVATQQLSADLHRFLKDEFDSVNVPALHELTGLIFRPTQRYETVPPFQVHSLRTAQRAGTDGRIRSQVIISLLQKSEERLDLDLPPGPGNTFTFRGGCTLILDLDTLELRYAIKKPIYDRRRLDRQRRYLLGEWGVPERAVWYGGTFGGEDEPFAMMHDTY
jgi:hypothetical protein